MSEQAAVENPCRHEVELERVTTMLDERDRGDKPSQPSFIGLAGRVLGELCRSELRLERQRKEHLREINALHARLQAMFFLTQAGQQFGTHSQKNGLFVALQHAIEDTQHMIMKKRRDVLVDDDLAASESPPEEDRIPF